MLKFTDYYRAKTNLKTPLGIIPQGALGNMSQYGDIIRFEAVRLDGTQTIIVCKQEDVRNEESLFEALDLSEAVGVINSEEPKDKQI